MSGLGRPVIERGRVLGFGKEQPSLDQCAAHHDDNGNERPEGSGPRVHLDGESRDTPGHEEGAHEGPAPQPFGVSAGDPIAHFLLNIVFLGAGRVQQLLLAHIAETGRRLRRYPGRVAVDKYPVFSFEKEGQQPRDYEGDTDPRRINAKQMGQKIKAQAAGPQ